MIRGTNTLRLNESTMIEAMQEWLDARTLQRYVGDTVVAGVKYEGNQYDGGFVVTLREKEGST